MHEKYKDQSWVLSLKKKKKKTWNNCISYHHAKAVSENLISFGLYAVNYQKEEKKTIFS